MSTSTVAFSLAAPSRKKSPRKVFPRYFFGSAALAGLVLGCAWTVYSNIFAASVYPSMGSVADDAPALKRPAAVASHPVPAFNEVFASLPPPPAVSKPETGSDSIMFNERFAAASPQGEPSRATEADPPAQSPRLAEAKKPLAAPNGLEAARKEAASSLQVALHTPAAQPEKKFADSKTAARQSGASMHDMAARAKAAVISFASNERQSIVEKLWGKREPSSSLLSFASADANVTATIPSTLSQDPTLGGSPPYDRQTAVYDISAHMVYLPDGTRLEAHSGLGSRLDDPRSAHMRMVGVTPPHIYELKPREALFHGVPALRLNPIGGEGRIFNRAGLLAHTYMLGPNGDSNGCVSFKDYYAFLDAYRNRGIRRLAVLARIQ
jgi:Protein of unknown function (DUF2778)